MNMERTAEKNLVVVEKGRSSTNRSLHTPGLLTNKDDSLMLTVKQRLNAFRLCATLALGAVSGLASPISVSNFSFETLPIGGLPFHVGTCVSCVYSRGVAIPGWLSVGRGTDGEFRPGPPGNT